MPVIFQAQKDNPKKNIDFSRYSTRHIAIRFAYVGWNYNGLAIQINSDVPTVEGAILDALYRTKMISSMDPGDCDFSRCGRTDKGVSALRQVISLRVRSLLTPEEQADPANDAKELDYIHILNQLLPDEIRLYEVALRPPEGFDARFSCQYRHYKYYFKASSAGLDLDRMTEAAKYFVGEHDFRNFCKVDGSKQITNFNRKIMSSSIMKVESDTDLYCFDLQGTAFLWHQVRSMMAILFLIGQRFEQPTAVLDLLNIAKTPRRPSYEMASEIPLVLYDSGFPEMEWKSSKSSQSLQRLEDRLFNTWHDYWMKYVMVSTMSRMVSESLKPPYAQHLASNRERFVIQLGNGKGKTLTKYVELSKRETLDPPKLVNERWLARRKSI